MLQRRNLRRSGQQQKLFCDQSRLASLVVEALFQVGAGGYQCQCSEGFQGAACQIDIDECSTGPCKNGGNCTDQVKEEVEGGKVIDPCIFRLLDITARAPLVSPAKAARSTWTTVWGSIVKMEDLVT